MATEENPEGSSSNTGECGSPPTIDKDAKPPAAFQSDEWQNLLDDAREPLEINISKRSLLLVDEHLSVLFDLHNVFITKGSKHQEQGSYVYSFF